jgi:hypothetical protein
MSQGGSRSPEQRLSTPFRVSFESSGVKGEGVAVNLSNSGLCLRSLAPLREQATVSLLLKVPDHSDVAISGEIRWVIEISPLVVPAFPWEAGVRFDNTPPEYMALFNEENQRFMESRQNPRLPHALRIQISGPGTWETTFALNLGRRGLFVRTDQTLEPGALLAIQVFLPGSSRPLGLKGEVVHHLTLAQAMEIGGQPGVGVRLLNTSDESREAYLDLLKHLEEHLRNDA